MIFKNRCRELLIQICVSENIVVLKGVVSVDHIHIEYPPKVSLSSLVNRFNSFFF
ncbi:transposase [Aquimarina sp. 2201CG1-2-11]|uniref:transposase n=1 Tax=Aquimarina discodermiae TaxID=3231043 RepID=UPI0034636D03